MDKTINLGGIEARVVNDTVRNSNTGILFEVAFDYFRICNGIYYTLRGNTS
jgi:hypothetical protein